MAAEQLPQIPLTPVIKCQPTLKGMAGVRCRAVALTKDGRNIVSASENNTIVVWDRNTHKREATLAGHAKECYAIWVTEDDRIFSASADNTVKVWAGKSLIKTLEAHTGFVFGVAVTADGLRIYTASEDKNVIAWDGKSYERLDTLGGETGHKNEVCALALSEDGHRIYSG